MANIPDVLHNNFCKSFGEHDVLISWSLTDLIIQQKNFAQLKQ